jgi:hypothetical protein
MDALALAATNEKAVLDNLVASNKTLSELTAKKIARIEELISSRGATPGAASSPADAKLVAQLRAAIKGKWPPAASAPCTVTVLPPITTAPTAITRRQAMLTQPLVPLLPAMAMKSISTKVGMLF